MLKIRTNNIEVKIYKTRSAMRKRVRVLGYNADHMEAVVIPCREYICKSGKCVKGPLVGEMYIHQKVCMPVLVHETLHAATTVIRSEKKSLNLGRNIYRNEERLAYTQTSILQDILKRFFPSVNSTYDFKDIDFWVRGSVKNNRKVK